MALDPATIKTIPLSAGQPFFDRRLIVDGIEFVFSFAWNDRAERWFLDVQDQTGAPIITAIKLVPPFALLGRVQDQRLTTGDFFIVGAIPTLATLGMRGISSLVYANFLP